MRDITMVVIVLAVLCFFAIGFVVKKEEAENLKLKLVFCEMKRSEGSSPF